MLIEFTREHFQREKRSATSVIGAKTPTQTLYVILYIYIDRGQCGFVKKTERRCLMVAENEQRISILRWLSE